MKYEHTPEEASGYQRIALPLMVKHGNPSDPLHYAVWYAYASGQNLKLTEEINQLLADNKKISTDVCKELYKKHIQLEAVEALELQGNVSKIMDSLSSELAESNLKVSHYGNVLDSVENEINQDIHPDVLQKIVDKLSSETNFIQAVNRSLAENLMVSSDELNALRRELDEVRKVANTDVLTGVPNRQAFDVKMNSLVNDPESQFSFMLLDIDHFKKFNDNYGHQLGDKVLRFVAQTLKKKLKGQDFVSRYGGEEFTIILPDTPFEGAMAVAENLRAAIQSQRLRRTDNQEYIGNITLSIGVSMYRQTDGVEDVIERADKALYMSKESGRNRITAETKLLETA